MSCVDSSRMSFKSFSSVFSSSVLLLDALGLEIVMSWSLLGLGLPPSLTLRILIAAGLQTPSWNEQDWKTSFRQKPRVQIFFDLGNILPRSLELLCCSCSGQLWKKCWNHVLLDQLDHIGLIWCTLDQICLDMVLSNMIFILELSARLVLNLGFTNFMTSILDRKQVQKCCWCHQARLLYYSVQNNFKHVHQYFQNKFRLVQSLMQFARQMHDYFPAS